MCRGPFAYGQATAERMCDMRYILLTALGGVGAVGLSPTAPGLP